MNEMPHHYIDRRAERMKDNSSAYLAARAALQQAADHLLDFCREDPEHLSLISSREIQIVYDFKRNGRQVFNTVLDQAREDFKLERELDRQLNAQPVPRKYINPLGASDSLDLGAD